MSKLSTAAVIIIASGFLFTACKKDKSSGSEKANTSASSGTALSSEDSLKYLMYHTMQTTYVKGGRDKSTSLPTYYWYSQVPSIDPLSSSYANADVLLARMASYPKDASGNSLDRYSFLDRTGALSSALQDGISEFGQKISATGDYGMEVSYASDGTKTYLYVLYADKNAPAYTQGGLTRGDEITAINGDTNIAYDGANGTNTAKVINAIYSSTSVTLKVTKANGTSQTVTLNAASYNINPVLFDTVFTVNSQKVGYFVFYTFPSTYNSSGVATTTKTVLDALFTKFQSQGINNLIVDLRYNGGGSVTTAEYLDSVIAPATAQKKVMYYYKYNDKLTANLNNTGLASSVLFPSTTGGLGLNNVFFITSKSTASASELTLNNLKPYMNVKTVGDTTYGKPVGFITFTISNYDSTGKENYLADLYAINFATENANHVGAYYSGIAPDQAASDYINVPWGYADHDDHLSQIFSYLKNGAFSRTAASARVATTGNTLRSAVKASIASPKFNGMVDFRLGKKVR
ncbi:S41 family peptidase [Chitinophaga sedimenti]|uniref:S41 family peptidase n=1 Tax=Chitinophaga sedimenti TaxID=2033606 RepID=UPI0020067696|nr:S41 family peptidase [Chitinophaga sedimenti]MCK7556132.1 S41 family peptidase [Chitinophaga sedimenti]